MVTRVTKSSFLALIMYHRLGSAEALLYKHCLYVTLLFRYMPDVTVLAAEKLNSTVFVAVVSHTIVDIIELNVSVFVLG